MLQALALAGLLTPAGEVAAAEDRVLVYTRNHTPDGKGYVHDNIAACAAALRQLGRQNAFEVDVSDDPAVFTDASLARYRAVVFANSNNEAFASDAQREAFQRYIRKGGGFAGIHSATGSERQWPWYWQLVGGSFAWHPPLQPFTIRIVDRSHPSTAFFDKDTWPWEDEFYTHKERVTGVRVLLAGELSSLKNPGTAPAGLELPDPYPLAWCREFEGGRSWYTALGHKKEHYKDPLFLKHLQGGIEWAMGRPARRGESAPNREK
jgi:type 1 glutamine amidotransferase